MNPLASVSTRIKQRYSVKVFITFTVFLTISSSALGVFFAYRQYSSLIDAWIKEGERLSWFLAHSSRIGAFPENTDLPENLVRGVLQREGVLSVSVFSQDGKLLRHQEASAVQALQETPGEDTRTQKEIFSQLAKSGASLVCEGKNSFEFWAPVLTHTEPVTVESLLLGETPVSRERVIGFVRVALGKEPLHRRGASLLVQDILMALAFLSVGALLTFLIAQNLTKPLFRLTKGVKALAEGGPAEKVPVETQDEIGNLALALNAMVESLKKREVEKRELEEQLMHAQKLEAVGTLSGGIAHDFNNIITAITGYGNLLLMELPADNPARYYMEQILASSERAAALTQGLLTFGRKQVVNAKAVHLNEVVKKLGGLLRRLIGEDIRITTTLHEGDVVILAGCGMIEQILMNLVTNARDAMPEGGLLTIQTGTAELDEGFAKTHGYGKPGEYASLSVSDSGVGIRKEVQDRIFEPFFTTEEVGKGTGLGLYVVYGIVKQHNGYITVSSEPNKETVFTIYFPLLTSEVVAETSPALEPVKGGAETVLVAEDDPKVRVLSREVLKQFGYTVVEAEDGEEAISKLSERGGRVDLLVLDVVMPKTNGKETYHRAKKLYPQIKVLFMSGYTTDIIHRKGILEDGIAFIPKPIAPRQFLKKVREVLDQ